MRTKTLLAFSLLPLMLTESCERTFAERLPEQIIALERAALNRWDKGDPQGYLETFAPEITYFDPNVEKRIDGLDAMKAYLTPFTGKFRIDRDEMIGPKVQVHGDVAVLSYNLNVFLTSPKGTPATVRWNCTEIYARTDGGWKIIHNHWSYIKPELKQPSPE